MCSAIGLAALVAALLFDFVVEAGEGGAFTFGIFAPIEFGVGFGEIEVHLRAARIEANGGFEFLLGFSPFSGVEKTSAKDVVSFGRFGSESDGVLGGGEGIGGAP